MKMILQLKIKNLYLNNSILKSIFLIVTFLFGYNLHAQVEVSLKSGVQMLGMFQSSNNVFGDGNKTLNPTYGMRICHKLTENVSIRLDGDFTGGNYFNLKQLNPSTTRFWRTLDYSLINTSVLLAYKLNNKVSIKSGIHFFFVGKIHTTAPLKPVTGGCFVVTDAFESSRAIGIPLGISFYLSDNFEFEVKWAGTLNEFTDRDIAYRRLETVSLNLFYTFKRNKKK